MKKFLNAVKHLVGFMVVFLWVHFQFYCAKDEEAVSPKPQPVAPELFINGADLSYLPLIEAAGMKFYDSDNQEMDAVTILKASGMNTIRLRLWYNPENVHSSFTEVKTMAARARSQGLKVWLTVHYSDSWADPGQQKPPLAWQNLDFDILKDSLYDYTKRIITGINPDYIQLGNEINPGLLLPFGDAYANEVQFLQLLGMASKAVRDYSSDAYIMIHYAGTDWANEFFDKLSGIDYDMIGISYYPFWHGKDLLTLKSVLTSLRTNQGKSVVIAETSYPFTLDWNDNTHNIVGLESQLILPDYPATPQGQNDYFQKIKEIVKGSGGAGICYWAPDWVAFDGTQSAKGSSWENMTLFDFNNRVLPAALVYGTD